MTEQDRIMLVNTIESFGAKDGAVRHCGNRWQIRNGNGETATWHNLPVPAPKPRLPHWVGRVDGGLFEIIIEGQLKQES